MNFLPETKTLRVKKRNRIKKFVLKKHTITHEHGRSTKLLWRQIIERAKKQ